MRDAAFDFFPQEPFHALEPHPDSATRLVHFPTSCQDHVTMAVDKISIFRTLHPCSFLPHLLFTASLYPCCLHLLNCDHTFPRYGDEAMT